MSVKLRLQRKGRKKAPFYHIVVADSRSPRDGRFIEKIGTYNPLTVPASIELDREKAYNWLMKGAQPTDTVNAILRFKGVLLKKHLQLGVTKGAITQEQADAKLNAWSEEKETRLNARRENIADKKREHIAAVDGKPKAKPKKPVVEADPVAEDGPVDESNMESMSAAAETTVTEDAPTVAEATAEAIAESSIPDVVAEEAAPAVEEVPETTEAPAVEETPAVVEDALESAEAPAAEETPAEEETPAVAEEEKATTEENTSEA